MVDLSIFTWDAPSISVGEGQEEREGAQDEVKVMINAESGLIAPMDPKAYSSPQCAQLMCTLGKGEGEESFPLSLLVFYRKAESGRGSASYGRKLHLLTLS